jgi:hypothetical protein
LVCKQPPEGAAAMAMIGPILIEIEIVSPDYIIDIFGQIYLIDV